MSAVKNKERERDRERERKEDDASNSAEWADNLHCIDNGGFRSLSLLSAADVAAAKIAKTLPQRQHQQQQQTHQTRQTGAALAAETAAAAAEDAGKEKKRAIAKPSPTALTRRIRARLWREIKDLNAVEKLVAQVSPSLLATSDPYLLIAYADDCPHSRAMEDGLVSLGSRLNRRNLANARGASPLSISMFDVSAPGNRSFALEHLRANPMPQLYIYDPYRRGFMPWQGRPMDDPVPNPKSSNGEWTRTLPENELLDALERCLPLAR